MPPRLRKEGIPVTPCTYGVEPRCIQASGIFRLPAELIIKILACFGDPHRNILRTKEESLLCPDVELVQQLTVIRKLTMTCWHLRNKLFPVLWKYVEGCTLIHRSSVRPPVAPNKFFVTSNGLYPQCSYLLLNPTVGAYVQCFSANLDFQHAPKDLIGKFVDCLVQLPNLRTLEIFSMGQVDLTTLARNSSRFPSVRELVINNETACFVVNCPNVETVMTPYRLSYGAMTLGLHGGQLKKLKRIVGVFDGSLPSLSQGCPNLQEICIKGTIRPATKDILNLEVVEDLRAFKCLLVVELDYIMEGLFEEDTDATTGESREDERKRYLKKWMRPFVRVLKDGPPNGHRLLRWKFAEKRRLRSPLRYTMEVVESGKLEAFPEAT